MTPQSSIPFPPESGSHRVLIDRVYDGDTVDVCFLVPARIRLTGLNSPEVRGREARAGLAARDALAGLLGGPTGVVLLHGREKYGRLLGTFLDPSGKSINEVMLTMQQASAWDGQGKRPIPNAIQDTEPRTG